ncbi:MAG: hypothetical protein V3U87_09860 [Methylococcaceae bacterium]
MKRIFILMTVLVTSGCWNSVELSSERVVQFEKIFDDVLSIKKEDQVFLSKLADKCGLNKTHEKRVEIYGCLNSGSVLGDSEDGERFSALLKNHGVEELASIAPIPFLGFLDTNELSDALEDFFREAKIIKNK